MSSYHHGDLREKLLKEAFKILDEHGASQLNMRELGKICGVSRSAAYRHFESKAHLLTELASMSFDEMYRAISLEVAKVKEEASEDRLIASGVGYVLYLTKYAHRQRLLFGNLGQESKGFKKDPNGGGKSFSLMSELIEQIALEKKRISKKSVSRYQSIGSWAIVHGLVELINNDLLRDLKSKDPKDIAQYVRAILKNTNFSSS